MTKIKETINDLIAQYGYQPLPATYSDTYRKLYEKNLPDWAKAGDLSIRLTDEKNIAVTRGYNKIVIGDYGAFVEFTKAQSAGLFRYMDKSEFSIMEHILGNFYILLSTRKGSGPRIYYWKYPVPFADFKPGMYYVSVYDVKKA